MIDIKISKSYDDFYNVVNVVSIKGHANSDVFGKDLVCASVSSSVYGFINYMNMFFKENIISLIDEKGNIEMKFLYNPNDIENIELIGAFHLLYITFETLFINYPKYISLKTFE